MLVHLIGVCGTAMAGVGAMLKGSGFDVQGSDAAAYPPMSVFLESQGIAIMQGYHAAHLASRPDLVVVGNVARRDNPEVVEAQRLGIRCLSMPQVLEEYFLAERTSITVTGTHGKTTVTSMTAWLLETAGLSPSFLVGGIPLDFGRNFGLGEGRHFVIEGDEYDTAFFDKKAKFFHYRPVHAVVTSLEYDHADIYPDFASLERTFGEFVGLIPPKGTLTWCADYPVLSVVTASARCKRVSYGFSEKADLRIVEVVPGTDGTSFRVEDRPGDRTHFLRTRLWGRHNVLNATAAFSVGKAIGISCSVIGEALASFGGVKRRFQVLSETGGVTLVDDFAHHPTAVRETLSAARTRFPGRRLLAAFHFESNTSRRKVFEQEFADAFRGVDQVFLTYPLRKNDALKPEDYLDPAAVLAGIRTYAEAEAFQDFEEMAAAVAPRLKPGDVLVGMSGRDFSPFYAALAERMAS